MSSKPLIAGVGMVPFCKPGRSDPYDVMGANAARAALADAGLSYEDVQQAYVGYVYGDSTSGQSALYHVGLSGIPIVNVNNNCASGSTALFLARQAVATGAVDVALALGFEQMTPGPLPLYFGDRTPTCERATEAVAKVQPWEDGPPRAAQLYGGAGLEYQARYGAHAKVFAMVAEKARKHASRNPFAVFQDRLTAEEVMAGRKVFAFLTREQCCPPTCGAAAALVVSADYARAKGLGRLVEVVAQTMLSDTPSSFSGDSIMNVVGYHKLREGAKRIFESTGIGPEDVDVCELHDCFTVAEVLAMEGLGLAGEGQAEKVIRDGDNTYGGQCVINPSGGLLSKGHPLGATGLAQCAELCWQLRGDAQERQVENARIALQHNSGMGSATVLTLYKSVSQIS